MTLLNQVDIEERSTTYGISLTYHSDMKCENYDADITGVQEADGRITIRPGKNPLAVGFIFEHSDPDRVIAIANMLLSFAQMVKNENAVTVDATKSV